MSEMYLRFGLLLIAASILALILLEAWHKRRRLKKMNTFESTQMPSQSVEHIEPALTAAVVAVEPAPASSKAATQFQDDLLMISVLAKPGCQFSSYELLQAILSAGLQFGEMNLFHYFLSTPDDSVKLFSLASATKTGEFDLDHMGDFSCKGLILFLDLNAVIELKKAFDLMLLKAQQLADDLDGDLHADLHTPWDNSVKNSYEKKIAEKNQVELGYSA